MNLKPNLDVTDFVQASDATLWSFWRDYGTSSGGRVRETSTVCSFTSAVPLPLLNPVICVATSSEGLPAANAEAQACADRTGHARMWYETPHSKPRDLGAQLVAAGLSFARSTTGMVLDLSILPHAGPDVPGLRIERADTPDLRATFAWVLGTAFDLSPDALSLFAKLEAAIVPEIYAEKPRFVGFLDDAPVATAAVVLCFGVAALYAVVTLPPARKRGIAAAMTVRSLVEGRQRGFKIGLLQATQMGRPLYRRLGFQDVCTYRNYLQLPTIPF